MASMISDLERLFPRKRDRLRQRVESKAVEGLFEVLSALGRRTPLSNLDRHGVEAIHDVPYLRTGREIHSLDVYRPRDFSGSLPICLYVHGGGFRLLSKDTHWLMGLIFARRGYLCFNINYRLAPTHPFPAAHEDMAAAWRWVLDNAHLYGGDTSRIVVAGESAGANLVTGLTLASTYERPEPWARTIFEGQRVPDAVCAACGFFEVDNHDRYTDMGYHRFFVDRLTEIVDEYRSRARVLHDDHLALCDPLSFLEDGELPDRQLPPFFLPVGEWDFLKHDNRRLKRALDRLGVDAEAREYPRGLHAFHAMPLSRQARRCWADHFTFLDRVFADRPATPVASASKRRLSFAL
jgi:acetyl esterase